MTTSAYDDAGQSPGFLLWHATLRWQRAMRAALAPHALTHVQFVLLTTVWWLGEHGGAPTQRGIADHAGTDPMMTSQVLRALEQAGLVTRTRDDADARAVRVELTAEGGKRLGPALRDVEAADGSFFAGVATPQFVTALGDLASRPAASSS